MNVIGIDLGTSRYKVSYLNETGSPQIVLNRRGEMYTPSAIYFEEGRKPIVGVEALAEGFLQPQHVHTAFKRVLGTTDVLYTDADGNEYTATDFMAILLRAIKEDVENRFNTEMDEVVITVPANYQDHRKQATIDAAELAGIKVLRLIHEPTAAGIAYAVDKKQDMRFLVYDLGGGTFDVSVLECKGDSITVLNTTGIEKLGGEDFNARIESYVVDQFQEENNYEPTLENDPLFFQELAEKVEQVKISLSEKTNTRIVIGCRGQQSIIEITRDQFESLTKDLLQETLDCTTQAIEEINLTWNDLDTILLVGGSVRMPAVHRELADLTGIVPHCDIEPDLAVCYGAALQCGMELSQSGKTLLIGGRAIPTPKAFVQEVTAHGVGCCVAAKDGTLSNAIILPKGTAIPTTCTDRFTLLHDGQTEARIEVLQGEEGQLRDECLSIGEIVLDDLPVEHKRTKRIEVQYCIDNNGMIRATGRDLISGKHVQINIDYHKGTTTTETRPNAA